MRRRARNAWLAACSAVLVLAAAHTALWFWAAEVLEQQVVANLAHGLAPGWRATHGSLTRGGWPLEAIVHAPTLELRQETGPWTWTCADLSASVSLLRPLTLVLSVSGPQTLRVAPAPPVPIAADAIRAEVPLGSGANPSLRVTIASLRADLPQGPIGLDRFDLHARAHQAARRDEPALTVDLAANGLSLPPGPWPLGPLVKHVGFAATVSGPVPTVADPREAALAWRDGGGTLTVRSLDIAWSDVVLSGTAKLVLDARLQPAGDATARITGYGAALDALVASGMLEARAAMAARAVLALMSRPAGGSGPPEVEVPFALENRTLSLGRIPLVRVPELVWQARR